MIVKKSPIRMLFYGGGIVLCGWEGCSPCREKKGGTYVGGRKQ